MKRACFYVSLFFIFQGHATASEASDFAEKVKTLNTLTLDGRENPSSILEQEEKKEEETHSADEDGPSYSGNKWLKTRQEVEDGSFGNKHIAGYTEIQSSTENAPALPPPQLEFTDSGTSLSVTGRKVISFNYSGKKYINEQTTVVGRKSTSLFDINQQMQVRMQGKVGEKITVNVDYDDTKTDKQDISVVYQGDPNEVVQNVSFGDIDLSLPATEFVSYNKQLFGIRADLKTNRLKITFIGSRTKGITKTKQFTGNTQFQTLDILDSNYVRRKYYDVTFGNKNRLPIKAGSEKIYIDQQTGEPVDGILISSITADDLGISASTYTGRFKLMSPGIDYVMDYSKGLVTFTRTLNAQDTVIINYQNYSGTLLSQNASPADYTTASGTGLFKIIKTVNDIYLSTSSEAGWQREIKTYYSIGQNNIVRDDGRGNFTLKVQNLNRQEVGSSLTPRQIYPDTIYVDFEQGVFNLDAPFSADDSTGTPDPQIYAPSPVSKRIFHIEYSYRLKTFTLEPNIVLNSEIIRVDGKKLAKNEEYYIDYDSGFITFYYPDRIGQNSLIDITYDVAPFAGADNQSLVGGRVSYDLSNTVSMGSTLLYQGNVKSNTTPNIGDLSNSMLVYEGDIQLKNLNLLGLRTTLGAEIAQSKVNPNLNNAAIVDNMEGVKQEDMAGMDNNYWYIASNPSGDPSHPAAITWTSQDINSTEINPNSPSDSKQRVLTVNYDFSVSTEVSIVFPFSATGLDFSQKNSFELLVNGDSSNTRINLHFGQIDENSDGSSGQTLYCSNGNIIYKAPKTEDLNCDGQLSSSEDTGWSYAAPSSYGYPTARYGALNGRIDTQDLNGNGRLDAMDSTGGDFGYVSSTLFRDDSNNNALIDNVNFSGWHTLVHPVLIASTETYRWANIKQVRLSLKKGSSVTGSIRIARIAAVGNTWNIYSSTNQGTMQVLAVNNIDNSSYIPIYNAGGEASKIYNDLYGSVSKQKSDKNIKTVSEQALEISYSGFYSTSTTHIYRRFTKALDLSSHKKFRFLLYNNAYKPYDKFYIKLGDDNNFFKASVPLDFTEGWRLYTIDQMDLTGDSIPDVWTNGSNYSMAISTGGNLSLQQVLQISAGVETSTDSAAGTVYLNEIHLTDPITRTGTAKKLQGDFEIPGFAAFGAKYRFVDRNFQTPVTAISNQDNEQQTAYLNLSKPGFFPTSYTASRQITTTPNTYITGANDLVNSLQQGKVEKFDGTASGNLSLWILPKIGLNYAKNNVKYYSLAREDDKNIYSGTLNYGVPLDLFILPKTINFNYSYTVNTLNYDLSKLISPSGYFDTDERTTYYSAKLGFTPFKGSSFNPGYTLSETKEKKTDLSDPSSFQKYPKSLQQTVELNSNLRMTRWFNPSFNYSMTTLENNNLTLSTVTVGQSSAIFNTGDIKTINRTSQGSINLTLNANDLLPNNKLIRSMVISSNYQLQDGDVWQNVEKDYDSRNKLWIRSGLHPQNPLAIMNSLTTRDSYSSTQRWQPFEGYAFRKRLAPLSTLSITNNFNLSKQNSYTTGTKSRTINKTLPDLIFTLSQLEVLTGTQRWLYGASLNLKHSKNINETKDISRETSLNYGLNLTFKLLNFLDSAITYNYRNGDKRDLVLNAVTQYTKHQDATLQGTFDYKKFIFTPKIDYSRDYTEGTLKTVTQDVTLITPSLLIKADIQAPKGLKLPFTKNTVLFTNRIIWTNTLSYAIKKSPITITDNNRLLSLVSSADYEASKNLRITINAGVQRFWNKYLKQEDYLSYQAGSTLTFQF